MTELMFFYRPFLRLPVEFRDEMYGHTILLNKQPFTAFHGLYVSRK